jgi:hypothetical protein
MAAYAYTAVVSGGMSPPGMTYAAAVPGRGVSAPDTTAAYVHAAVVRVCVCVYVCVCVCLCCVLCVVYVCM